MDFCISDIINNPKFIDFFDRITLFSNYHKLNHTMIGCNFNDNEGAFSIKFYFVYYGDLIDIKSIPTLQLYELFDYYKNYQDNYFLSTKATPGGGLTFTIKFDQNLDTTEGFYFRLNKDNNHLVKNIIETHSKFNFIPTDFDKGYGQYALWSSHGIVLNEYLYLNNKEKLIELENKYGILYSNSSSIEISSAGNPNSDKHKFIALSLNMLHNTSFGKTIPNNFIQYALKNNLRLICPAASQDGNIKTIYLLK